LKPFFREGHDEKLPTAGDAARCLAFFTRIFGILLFPCRAFPAGLLKGDGLMLTIA
jgi:hypothetical protein